jgi:hypothetical protein
MENETTQQHILHMLSCLHHLNKACMSSLGDEVADALHDFEISSERLVDFVRGEYNVQEVEAFDRVASHEGSGIKLSIAMLDEVLETPDGVEDGSN